MILLALVESGWMSMSNVGFRWVCVLGRIYFLALLACFLGD